MEEVFLKKSVVALDAGQAKLLCDGEPGVVCDEGCLDMHDVVAGSGEPWVQRADAADGHGAILRVLWHGARAHAHDPVLGRTGCRIVRCDKVNGMAQSLQFAPERLDRRGNDVDAGEIHVRDHENFYRHS